MSNDLIAALQQLPGSRDPYLSKRMEHRTNLRAKAQLDVRRADGDISVVFALDVSDSGIGFLSRTSLEVNEQIGLRLAFQHDSEFEHFTVQRGTGTIGGFKVGVVTS